ncbi:DUF3370 domain-containing protein [Phormidium sp. CCY1219]|uniref:DUF3370 domain-containing protein n=1 Tax=Phormidium sp. CCY1219 TaxID=2886104 RepID=UPI002D1F98AD|nr:DUF3370 domain-containing protein [Phormidium sp. CCY1219]MEB3827743.1 DUF3370 domain-containing protein [Phormidium sp. CCY1219]
MLSLLLAFSIAQTDTVTQPQTPVPPTYSLPQTDPLPSFDAIPDMNRIPPKEVVDIQDVRPLPGQLDGVPVFNSNSPEVVLTPGILLSTFPPDGFAVPEAHLNFPFEGRFDLFAHHIARARSPEETRTFYQGLIAYNPTAEPVILEVLQGASYLTSPDALFIELEDMVANPDGEVYSGPGSRVMNDILRGKRQENWPAKLEIPPGEMVLLMNDPIPVGTVVPSSNARSTMMRLWSSGPVYLANLAMRSPLREDGTERAPTLAEWQGLLQNAGLAGPRDLTPTPLDPSVMNVVFGRVAGVAQGSQWRSQLTDTPSVDYLTIPDTGEAFSYALNTLHRITLGTEQIQSAKMLTRYPDTAYFGHGNYGVEYNLFLPLANFSDRTQQVSLTISSPLKEDEDMDALLFFQPRDPQVFFRGTVRVRYNDDEGLPQTRYFHLVQRRGQAGEPLLTLTLPPGDRRLVEVDFLYPPDATPPQVLTVRTLPNSN